MDLILVTGFPLGNFQSTSFLVYMVFDKSEVPLDSRYHTFDETDTLGKSCYRGHRRLVSKSIAYCVKAVIDAFLCW